MRHTAASKTFGGVGLLIKSTLFDTYHIQTVHKAHDGFVTVLFKDKQTDFSFIVICSYLPPQGSVYTDPTTFLDHVLSDLVKFKCRFDVGLW